MCISFWRLACLHQHGGGLATEKSAGRRELAQLREAVLRHDAWGGGQ